MNVVRSGAAGFMGYGADRVRLGCSLEVIGVDDLDAPCDERQKEAGPAGTAADKHGHFGSGQPFERFGINGCIRRGAGSDGPETDTDLESSTAAAGFIPATPAGKAAHRFAAWYGDDEEGTALELLTSIHG